jgi:hypothetical protein
LEDYSKVAIQQQVAVLKGFKQQFERVDAAGLSPEVAVDRELVLGDINSRLLEIENIRRMASRRSVGVQRSFPAQTAPGRIYLVQSTILDGGG